MNINNHFGQSLKAYLEAKGLKGTWLAKKLGKSSSAIYEYYKFKNPRPETEQIILEALGITLNELLSYPKTNIVEEKVVDYKPRVTYKTKQELDFEKKEREWQEKENAYLKKINELQEEKIKILSESNRATKPETV